MPQDSVFARVRFDVIDKHAEDAAKENLQTPKDLVRYLIKPAKNDFEKIRAIYHWMVKNIRYDNEGLKNSAKKQPNDALSVWKNRLCVCEGYANLFDLLCFYTGMPSVKISGVAKGAGYSKEFAGESLHAWNMVTIQKRLYLLDATWGTGSSDKNEKPGQDPTNHYFCTNPEEFILDHFPESPYDQLLPVPASKDVFLSFVDPDFPFFANKMQVTPLSIPRLHKDSVLVVRLTVPGATIINGLEKTMKNRLSVEVRSGKIFFHPEVLRDNKPYKPQIITSEKDGKDIVFRLKIQDPGEYDFQVIITTETQKNSIKYSIQERLLNFGLSVRGNPKTLSELRKQKIPRRSDKFKYDNSFGIQLANYDNKYAIGSDSTITLQLNKKAGTKISCEIYGRGEKLSGEFIEMKPIEHNALTKVSAKLKFPHPGEYEVIVYGRHVRPGESLFGAFSMRGALQCSIDAVFLDNAASPAGDSPMPYLVAPRQTYLEPDKVYEVKFYDPNKETEAKIELSKPFTRKGNILSGAVKITDGKPVKVIYERKSESGSSQEIFTFYPQKKE